MRYANLYNWILILLVKTTKNTAKRTSICLSVSLLYSSGRSSLLILVLVEQEVFFSRIIGPNVFDSFVDVAFVFKFLKIFNYFHRRT